MLVAEAPAHKRVVLAASIRKRLAEAAFPDFPVELDRHPYTVETLDSGRWPDAIVLIGADQFVEFLSWKDPDGVLTHVSLAVATRPGYARDRLETVRAQLARPDRVRYFELDPIDVASRELRAHVAEGRPIDGLVPPGVARLIRERALYRAR